MLSINRVNQQMISLTTSVASASRNNGSGGFLETLQRSWDLVIVLTGVCLIAPSRIFLWCFWKDPALQFELGRFRVFFFFSSRRRHTRLVSDWSSDVCSSD